MMMQGVAVATMGLLLGCADAATTPPKHVIFFLVRRQLRLALLPASPPPLLPARF